MAASFIGRSPATTVNKTTVVLLRRVMRYARDNWDVAMLREPVWRKHLLKQVKRPVRELMPSEEATLDAVEDRDFAEVRRFAIITGLRRGNVLLKKTQVNFEAGTLAVISKGGVPRLLPLSAEAYAILWRRRHDHPQVFFTFKAQRTRKCPKTGALFVRGERYPITYYGLGTNKRAAGRAAGVIARIHDLRHTTGMRTLRATGNLKTVQVLLGHTDIKITAQFYTDATLGDLRAAMDATSAATPSPPLLEFKNGESQE
jgi:integrase